MTCALYHRCYSSSSKANTHWGWVHPEFLLYDPGLDFLLAWAVWSISSISTRTWSYLLSCRVQTGSSGCCGASSLQTGEPCCCRCGCVGAAGPTERGWGNIWGQDVGLAPSELHLHVSSVNCRSMRDIHCINVSCVYKCRVWCVNTSVSVSSHFSTEMQKEKAWKCFHFHVWLQPLFISDYVL